VSPPWDPQRPNTITASPDAPSILSTLAHDEDKGADFQAHKVAFFFKLERELEKVVQFLFFVA
jgi:CDK inhibitor PHO81